MTTRMTNIDWSTVDDGLGTAEAVPALVAGLGAKKIAERRQAFVALADERLVHEGRRTPAAPLAVPLLAEALRTPKHPGKPLVLATLARIAVGSPALYARGAAGLPSLEDLEADAGVEGASFRATRAAADAIEQHLDDRSGATRAAAAAALAVTDPRRAADRIVARLATEDDADARVAMLLALAVAARLGGRVAPPPVVDGASDAVRAAHAVAAAHLGMPVDVAALSGALSEPLATTDTPFGPLGDVALGAALALGPEGVGLVETALAGAPPERLPLLADALIRAVLPGAEQGRPWLALIPSRQLTPAALAAIRLVAARAPAPSWGPLSLLPSVGVTRVLRDLRRFVGLDPAGPLERLIAWRGAEVEVVVVLDAVAREEIGEEEGGRVLRSALPPPELVDAAILAADNAYDLHVRPAWSGERAVAFSSSLLTDPSALPRLLERVPTFTTMAGFGRWVLVAAVHRLSPGVDDAPWRELLAATAPNARGTLVAILRDAVAAAPADLRDALALTVPLPDAVERSPRIMGRPVGPRLQAWNLLDLAVDRRAVARRAAAAVAAWTPLPEGDWQVRPVDEARRVLAALRPESLAAIEEVLSGATDLGRSILEPILRPS